MALTLWSVTWTLGETPNLAFLSTEHGTGTDVSHCGFSYSLGYYTLIAVLHFPRYVCSSLCLCDLSLSSCAFICDAPVAFVFTSSSWILNFPLTQLTAANTGGFRDFVTSHAHGQYFPDRTIVTHLSFHNISFSSDFQIGCAGFSEREISKIFAYAVLFT